MSPLYTACLPRADIIGASFNPQLFTASLGSVIDVYAGRSKLKSLYTDGKLFFEEATFPTGSMQQVVRDVLSRLAGDGMAPSVHRLETGFGGGKTHTLIGLTHLAHKGTQLATSVKDWVDANLLPAPGEVQVVGVVGDAVDIIKARGTETVPHTLWGEIALQLGGESLYDSVQAEAESRASPGHSYFDKVLGARKVLIMLDELAAYAARLEAQRAGYAQSLSSYLMALINYARDHSGISLVVTLSSANDAFGGQASTLAEVLSKAAGHDISAEDARARAIAAAKGINSVISRDAVTFVPVQPSEISRVLARRLFQKIDTNQASSVAGQFAQMYGNYRDQLPDEANRADFKARLADNYPFHPKLIDFLTQKLSTVENFQGTRGVLRVLAYVVRNMWAKHPEALMIQTDHIDLTDPRLEGELVSRTGSSELLPVLNVDVGGPGTGQTEAGVSRAAHADQRNPHPQGYPMHVYVWRTVFLHSLAARNEGLQSRNFGITQRDALFEASFPGMPPAMVKAALDAIKDEAIFLREKDGRYFASTDPSVNKALRDIKQGVTADQARDAIHISARKIAKSEAGGFRVKEDVADPGDVEDSPGKPCLALVQYNLNSIDVDSFIQKCSDGKPRKNQNMVFLLVPQTVKVKDEMWSEDRVLAKNELEGRLQELARDVLARRRLLDNPDAYGLTHKHLEDANFKAGLSEREVALLNEVTRMYDSVWYPSASGQTVRKDVRVGAGESGVALMGKLRGVLITDGELLTAETVASKATLMQLAKSYFFVGRDHVSVKTVGDQFSTLRNWPVLESPALLDSLIRAGVDQGHWCLFNMGSAEATKPAKFYSRETGALPLNLDLTQVGWQIVTVAGAKQRGWGSSEASKIDVRKWLEQHLTEHHAARVSEAGEVLRNAHGDISDAALYGAVQDLLKDQKLHLFTGDPAQTTKPTDIVTGISAFMRQVNPADVLMVPAEVSQRGWLGTGEGGGGGGYQYRGFHLYGEEATARLWPILGKLGSYYVSKGAKTTFDELTISSLHVAGGALLTIQLQNATPETMKALQEFFENVANIGQPRDDTVADIRVNHPEASCSLLTHLKGSKP